MGKFKVSILGATGMVGQAFVLLLNDHPYFEVKHLVASDRREGKKYRDSTRWLLPGKIPENVGELELESIDKFLGEKKNTENKIVFSALPSDVAAEVEPELSSSGYFVFSNASAMRYREDVPILIPEANVDSISLIEKQGFPQAGFVVTNANCSTTGLAVALAPLRKFGIEQVFVSTYQSISGAGYPGIASLDILGNVLPYIEGEEKKIQVELKKILGVSAEVYPYCFRVPVDFGHLETIWVKFEKQVNESDIREAWEELSGESFGIPTMPKKPIAYLEDSFNPQPRLAFAGDIPGMVVFTGRLRKENNMIGFVLLVNNIIKGAAGGSVQNAEVFVKKYGRVLGWEK